MTLGDALEYFLIFFFLSDLWTLLDKKILGKSQ